MTIRLALATLALLTFDAAACSCMPPPANVDEAVRASLATSDAVVLAEARTVETVREQAAGGIAEQQYVDWHVQKSWKGQYAVGDTLRTATETTCCMCGRTVHEGEVFVLHLHGNAPYGIRTCGLSGTLEEVGHQVPVLDKLR